MKLPLSWLREYAPIESPVEPAEETPVEPAAAEEPGA